jgi:hypothetical protein
MDDRFYVQVYLAHDSLTGTKISLFFLFAIVWLRLAMPLKQTFGTYYLVLIITLTSMRLIIG